MSINTTVAHETLDALDRDGRRRDGLGVDAIGLNHLMYSTPDEVAETVASLGAGDASSISTFVTTDPGLDPARVREQVDRARSGCRERAPVRHAPEGARRRSSMPYYTPGARLEGRCLYPFLYARVSFSGKMYFCPFIRVEVGDLTHQSLEEVWTGDRYVALRQTLVQNGIFPVCRRCCKVELTPAGAGAGRGAPRDAPAVD